MPAHANLPHPELRLLLEVGLEGGGLHSVDERQPEPRAPCASTPKPHVRCAGTSLLSTCYQLTASHRWLTRPRGFMAGRFRYELLRTSVCCVRTSLALGGEAALRPRIQRLVLLAQAAVRRAHLAPTHTRATATHTLQLALERGDGRGAGRVEGEGQAAYGPVVAVGGRLPCALTHIRFTLC